MNQQAQEPYKVFISFKSAYKPMAEVFREQLDLLGGNDIEINMSTDIAASKNWREWIREKIMDSNLLILLFTAPKGTWDWCLYEVGLFREPADLDKRPVVCVHNPNYETPDPIKDLQSVKANLDGLKEFLKKFYGTVDVLPDAVTMEK